MAAMYLLDTDIYTLFRNGSPGIVRLLRSRAKTARVGTTIITKLEILRGRSEFLAKASSREQFIKAQALYLLDEHGLSEILVFLVDEAAIEHFFRLQAIKGLKKIGRNDLLIASIALANSAVLVTRNERHFRRVPYLTVENWAG